MQMETSIHTKNRKSAAMHIMGSSRINEGQQRKSVVLFTLIGKDSNFYKWWATDLSEWGFIFE